MLFYRKIPRVRMAVRKYQNGDITKEKAFAPERPAGLLPWVDFPERVSYQEGVRPEKLSLQIEFKKAKPSGSNGEMREGRGIGFSAVSGLGGKAIETEVAEQMRQPELKNLEKILQQWYLQQ